MDPEPSHIIRRQILEFRGARESDARQLQDEVGKVFEEKFLPLLDQYLSAQSPDDVVHRIDRLELDLGVISRNNLEEDFFQELTRQLEIYFQPQEPSESDFEEEKTQVPDKKSHLEIFSFFIETGSLPWWVESDSPDPVKESLDFLIQEQQSMLISLMYRWVNNPSALKRIVLQVGFPKWAELVVVNMDCTGVQMTSLLSRLMDLLRNIAPWNKYSKQELQKTVGLMLLPWVYVSPYKKQNNPDFWRNFLVQLAAGQGVKYEELFAELSQQYERGKQPKGEPQDPLSVLFSFSWKEITPVGSLQAKLYEEIKHLLEVKALHPEQKRKWLEHLKLLNEQVLEDKELLMIADLLEQAYAAETDLFGDKDTFKTDRSPTPSTFMWKGITPQGSIQANLFEEIKNLLSVKALSADNKIKWRDYLELLNKQVLEDKDLEAIQFEKALAAETDKADHEDPDRQDIHGLTDMETDDFSVTEELFVDNGGLVMLWPFFTRFFEKLDLISEGRFADDAAAHRGVGLLQYLVDGQDMPAEHRCGLNKILCGLDAETVLDFGEPVTAKEAEFCESLLEAVLVQAPILGEMSVEGIRSTFLIRNGLLRAGKGIWQLNVERKTYDIILERLPWSLSIVKLPWMEWAIDVEWV